MVSNECGASSDKGGHRQVGQSLPKERGGGSAWTRRDRGGFRPRGAEVLSGVSLERASEIVKIEVGGISAN